MRRQVWSAVALALAILLAATVAWAQDQGDAAQRRAQFAGMQRVMGTITSISGPQVTIKTVDGVVYQVTTTDNTRVMHGRGEAIKLADLKAGDGLMAMGNLDAPNKTMHAAMVVSVDADQMKKMEDAYKEQLASLGKTQIMGRVTAIDLDNATMTVERPDGVSQTIGFDEETSFKRGRIAIGGNGNMGFRAGAGTTTADTTAPSSESITLADVKVGDRVAGPGQMKNGRFVSKELTVMTPGAGRRRPQGTDSSNGEGQANAGSSQPSPQTPK